jgi:hypothetical protein
MRRLTRADAVAAHSVTYIETKYGRELGVRRLPTSFITRTQLLYSEPARDAAGRLVDPLGVGFLDVECPACGASVRAACEAFGAEAIPHEGRVTAAHQDRVARGNRGALRAAIVDPPVDDAVLEYLEGDPVALLDLITQVVEISGLGDGARAEAGRTFREGVPRPADIPTPGGPDVPLPPRAGAGPDS